MLKLLVKRDRIYEHEGTVEHRALGRPRPCWHTMTREMAREVKGVAQAGRGGCGIGGNEGDDGCGQAIESEKAEQDHILLRLSTFAPAAF